MKEYVNTHLGLALRLLRRSFNVGGPELRQLVRGGRKHTSRRARPGLQKAEVRQLVELAVRAGWSEVARIFVVARSWLFRVADELWPLQFDGRSGQPRDSQDWHSVVTFDGVPAAERAESSTFPMSAVVVLRTRKNESGGATLSRRCSRAGRTDPCPDVLCGVCALFAQVRVRCRGARVKGSSPIFTVPRSPASTKLRDWSKAIGLESCPGWHAFRRGMARDMLESGSHLSAIMRAGGWKSSAVLSYLSKSQIDRREAVEYMVIDSESEAES